MRNAIIVVVVLLLLGGGYFLFNAQKSTQPKAIVSPAPTTAMEDTKMKASPSASTMSPSSSEEAAMKNGAVKAFTVENKGFSFIPSTLTVNKGDKVKVTFKNTGGMHNWALDEFNAKTKTIQSGEEDTVEFTADKAGTFEYYCSVGNHRQMGMKGTLTVK